jgi:ribosomal subunit interface protein
MGVELEAYLQERLDAIERLLDPNDTTVVCDIELARDTSQQSGRIWRAEINLQRKGEMLRVTATEESINAAIDEVKDEMMKRLRRSNNKQESLMRRGGAKLKKILRFGR